MERGLRTGPGVPLLEETWKADSLALICNLNGLYCTRRAPQPCEATCRDEEALPRTTLLPLKVLISVRGPRLSRQVPILGLAPAFLPLPFQQAKVRPICPSSVLLNISSSLGNHFVYLFYSGYPPFVLCHSALTMKYRATASFPLDNRHFQHSQAISTLVAPLFS